MFPRASERNWPMGDDWLGHFSKTVTRASKKCAHIHASRIKHMFNQRSRNRRDRRFFFKDCEMAETPQLLRVQTTLWEMNEIS